MPEYRFSLTRIFHIKIILSFTGKTQVRENPYSGMFYAVYSSNYCHNFYFGLVSFILKNILFPKINFDNFSQF